MEKVTVRLEQNKDRDYDICIGPGLISNAGELIRSVGLSGKAVIITDSKVSGLYSSVLQRSLAEAGFETALIEVPEGERQKSLETAGKLYTELTEIQAERTTPIIALGGGVIGDLAGFVAATYMRGVPLVQVPTTLLAQGDSSIGGKTAVNHGNIKNKIGAFYHPKLTISDTSTLKTLSGRAFSDGLSEITKYGIILDREFFNYLEANIKIIRSLDDRALVKIVTRAASLKAGIVEQDEFDRGLRNILNYGHTIGHAVESVSGLTIWHGEAVAIGMAAEAGIARQMGLLAETDAARITGLLDAAGLPTTMPSLDQDLLMEAMQHDKKITQGKLKFALPKGIGTVDIIDDVPSELVRQSLGKMR